MSARDSLDPAFQPEALSTLAPSIARHGPRFAAFLTAEVERSRTGDVEMK